MADNPMAFPSPDWNGKWEGPDANHGMSLRDWFAGQALSGRMAIVADDDGCELWDAFGNDLKTSEGMASSCYDIADAMLAERERRK